MLQSLEARRLLSSPEGVIVFQSDREGNHDIYSMDPDGSHIKNLTNNPAIDAIPQVSDDGTKVAFASDRGHTGNIDIWLMDIDGSHLVNITHNGLPGATNWDPAPSPDNSKVLYMGPGNGKYELWTSDADGTHPKNLTNGFGGSFASWSDDGSKIVFSAYPAGSTKEEVYWMYADGSHITRVTNNPARDYYAAFNHDATKVAFMSDRDGNREIYECKLDGTGLVNLTNNPATDQVPYYSPEGDKISFNSDRDGNMEVYIMDANGANQTRITNNPALDVYPGWGEVLAAVTDAKFDFESLPNKLIFTFNQDVSGSLSANDLNVVSVPGNVPVSVIAYEYNSTTNTATYHLGGALADGNYRATFLADHPLESSYSFDFFALGGDANHDRNVDLSDMIAFSSNWLTGGNKYSQGDFNYDGSVDARDLTIIAKHWQQHLDPAPVVQLLSVSMIAPTASAPITSPSIHLADKKTVKTVSGKVILTTTRFRQFAFGTNRLGLAKVLDMRPSLLREF